MQIDAFSLYVMCMHISLDFCLYICLIACLTENDMIISVVHFQSGSFGRWYLVVLALLSDANEAWN